jgi:hypothetical protein
MAGLVGFTSTGNPPGAGKEFVQHSSLPALGFLSSGEAEGVHYSFRVSILRCWGPMLSDGMRTKRQQGKMSRLSGYRLLLESFHDPIRFGERLYRRFGPFAEFEMLALGGHRPHRQLFVIGPEYNREVRFCGSCSDGRPGAFEERRVGGRHWLPWAAVAGNEAFRKADDAGALDGRSSDGLFGQRDRLLWSRWEPEISESNSKHIHSGNLNLA